MFTPARFIRTAALVALGLAATHGAAYADVYSLTLSATSGPESGTGSLTVTGPVGTGLWNFGPLMTGASHLSALDFMFVVGGTTFTFDLSTGAFSAGEFLNGKFYDITYASTINGPAGAKLTLDTTGGYAFYDNLNGSLYSTGTITSALETNPIATPEPMSFALLGTMVLLLWFPLRRRFHQQPGR